MNEINLYAITNTQCIHTLFYRYKLHCRVKLTISLKVSLCTILFQLINYFTRTKMFLELFNPFNLSGPQKIRHKMPLDIDVPGADQFPESEMSVLLLLSLQKRPNHLKCRNKRTTFSMAT